MNEFKEELDEDLVPIGASPLETLSQSIVGNLSLQKEYEFTFIFYSKS